MDEPAETFESPRLSVEALQPFCAYCRSNSIGDSPPLKPFRREGL